MAQKIKYSIEYPIRCSPHVLYDFIATANGLSEWFADKVDNNKEKFEFTWNGNKEYAVLVESKHEQFAKFRWDYMSNDEYFEFRIVTSDVTSETELVITDFAEKNDLKDQQALWESQIHELKHRVGS
jgi:hypothetical protein